MAYSSSPKRTISTTACSRMLNFGTSSSREGSRVTEDDIADLLRSGDVRLAFDTNAVEGDRRRDAVCNKVLQWNRKLSDQHLLPVRLVVCAVAHHEKVFHLKQRFGTTFDPSIIEVGLKSKGLVIEAYDARHALETGAWIGERYPTHSDWHLAKKERSLRSIGLDPSKVAAPAQAKVAARRSTGSSSGTPAPKAACSSAMTWGRSSPG